MFGACRSGPLYGSSTYTSIAAPATLPDSSAAISAASSTSSPRAALTMRTPSRICAIAVGVDRVARVIRERQVEGQEV